MLTLALAQLVVSAGSAPLMLQRRVRPPVDGAITCVSTRAPNVVIVATDAGEGAVSRDDGHTWTTMRLPSPLDTTGSQRPTLGLNGIPVSVRDAFSATRTWYSAPGAGLESLEGLPPGTSNASVLEYTPNSPAWWDGFWYRAGVIWFPLNFPAVDYYGIQDYAHGELGDGRVWSAATPDPDGPRLVWRPTGLELEGPGTEDAACVAADEVVVDGWHYRLRDGAVRRRRDEADADEEVYVDARAPATAMSPAGSRLWVAAESSLMLLTNAPLPARDPSRLRRLETWTRGEPSLEDTLRAAWRQAGVDPAMLAESRSLGNLRHLAPTVSFAIGYRHIPGEGTMTGAAVFADANYRNPTFAEDRFALTRDADKTMRYWVAFASWDLVALVFDAAELPSAPAEGLRDQGTVSRSVQQLFDERRTLLATLLVETPADVLTRTNLLLRVEELTSLLDVMTDGLWRTSLAKVPALEREL